MWGLPSGTVFMIFYLFIFAIANLIVTYYLCKKDDRRGGVK